MSWNKVAVVGAGLIKMGELFDQSYEQMAAGAFDAAVAERRQGLRPAQVEAAFVATQRGTLWGQEGIGGNTIPTAIGLVGIPCTRIENACPSGSDAFRVGAMAVASGVHDVVLVIGVEKMRDKSTEEGLLSRAAAGHPIFTRGETAPVLFAPFATRHMHEFGTTREMLASVAVKNHYNGARDPYAHFQNEITIEDVLKSAPVCHPLHLLDCCPQTDGAAAILLVNRRPGARVHRQAGVRRRVRRRHRPPVPAREGQLHRDQGDAARRAARVRDGGRRARATSTAPRCTTASRSPRSSTSRTSASSRRATAAAPASKARPTLTGRIPVNTSGGLLAKGHPIGATGVAQITECWWQLRGDAGERQVEMRNGFALQHNAGGRGSGVSRRQHPHEPTRTERVTDVCASRRRDDGVGRIVLDRPDAQNALTIEMRDGIIDAVRDVPRRPRRCARCSSPATGDAFCAGMDLTASTVAQAGKPGFATAVDVRGAARGRADVHPRAVGARQADGRRGQRRRGRARARTSRSRATSCSCTRRPRFMWTFPKWGLVVDAGGAYLLPRLVGLPRAKAMVMLGESATGAEAVDLGLAYQCVDDADALLPGTAEALAASPRGRPDAIARPLEAAAERDRSRRTSPTRSSSKATSRRWPRRRPISSRGWPRSRRSGTLASTASEPRRACSASPRTSCASTTTTACCCAGSPNITTAPGAWTLPGGGVEFGEHPEVARAPGAARRDRAHRPARRTAVRRLGRRHRP